MPRLRVTITSLRKLWEALRLKARNAGRAGTALVSLCALAFVWTDIAQHLASEKAEAERAALQNASNLSRAFEEHIIRTLADIDQALLFLRTAYTQDPKHFDIALWAQRNRVLSDMVLQVSIIGRDGRRVASSQSSAPPGIDLGDREYFQTLADSAQDDLVISRPVIGRASRQWSVPLTRRITAPDGSFAGVVTAALNPQYLSRFYGTVDVGARGVVVLIGTDRIVRARASATGATLGQSLAGSPLFKAYELRDTGSFSSPGVIDEVARLFSYRKVRGYPLVVEVGFAEEEVLEHYHRNLAQYVTMAALLSLLLLAATVLTVRHQGRLHKTREALAASEKKYRSVVDNLNEIVFETDEEGRWSFLNPTWSDVLGFSIEESLGCFASGYVDSRDRALFREKLHALLDGRAEGDRADIRCVAKDGGVRWLQIAADVLRDGAGRIIGVSGSLNDITHRKRSEQDLRQARDRADSAARGKSDFLAMMSHEIRSPMNGVIGIIDLLGVTALNPEQRQMVDLTRESAASLLCILNDILDFSKIEAGAFTIAPESTDLKRLVSSVRESMALSASAKGLSVDLEFGPGLPDHIRTDPVRLRQILVNLLSNAIKFTTTGSVRITVARATSEAGAELLRFWVIDTGIGMPADVVARLFAPFMQADVSTTRTFGGTGLGLSISHRLARLLSGDLRVTSEAGVGSVFTLDLPLTISERAPSVRAPDEFDAAALAPLKDARVLVAEDMATNRWLIKRQLERLGLAADAVETGAAALAALESTAYELLITDVHMPGMDGIALASHVRETESREGRARLPIIGLTADITRDMHERCRAGGMDEVMAKPTNLKHLGEALARLLPGRRPEPPDEMDAGTDRHGRVFDASVYRELFEAADPDGCEWLAEFLRTAERLLQDLQEHAAVIDREALGETAHRLAGTALSAGAIRLGKVCRALEAAAPTGEPATLKTMVESATDEFRRSHREIIRFTSGAKEPVS